MIDNSLWNSVPYTWDSMKQGKPPHNPDVLVIDLKPLYKDNICRSVSIVPIYSGIPYSYDGFAIKAMETDVPDKTSPIHGATTYVKVIEVANKVWTDMVANGWSETPQEVIRHLYLKGEKLPFKDISSIGLVNFDEEYKIVISFKGEETPVKELLYETPKQRNDDFRQIMLDVYSLSENQPLREINPIRS